jgi:polysaccharide export outer membrane protein
MLDRRLVQASLLIALLSLSGCAGGPPMDLLSLPGQSPDEVIRLGDPDQIVTWDRQLDPSANSTFVTISGTPYYRLGSGDELEISLSLLGETQVSRVVVDPNGDIHLPDLLGDQAVRLTGLAIPQAEERLRQDLSRVLRRPRVFLSVTGYNSSYATLVGELGPRGTSDVSGEGRYALTGRTTLLEFILVNASFTAESDLTAVIVSTADGKTGVFDLSRTIYSRDHSQNPVVDRADFVTVPSVAVTRRRIYVLGEVVSPGMVIPRPGMTLLDALAHAGGLNDRATGRIVSLVRGRGESAQLYKIPYNRIVKRGDTEWDLPLRQGDIIYVSRSSYDVASELVRDLAAVLQAGVIVTVLNDRIR